MKTGKLNPKTLDRTVIPYKGSDDPDVMLGPTIGGDSAVIKNSGEYLVISADPITGAAEEAGKFLVKVNANDVASSGGTPRWMTVTLLVSPDYDSGQIEEDMRTIDETAEKMNIAVVSGHTERVKDLEAPIFAGSMVGVAPNYLDPKNVKFGDKIVMTGWAGIEGTSILASTFKEKLLEKDIENELISRAEDFIEMISIVEEAGIGRNYASLMHDPTEGGVIGALGEISQLIGKPISFDGKQIPTKPETDIICKALGVNPFHLISSGSLILICPEQNVPEMTEELKHYNPCVIGEVSEEGSMPHIPQDELWRILEKN